MGEMVLQTLIGDGKEKSRALELIAGLEGVDSDALKREEGRITLIGEVDPEYVLSELRKSGYIAQLRVEQIGSRSLSEHVITIRQNSSRSRSRDLGIDRLSTGPSEANDLYIQYIQRFADLAPAFHWGVLVFTLGSCASWLSNPVFWLCWSVLITEAVIFYAIQPYCNWIEDSTQTTDQSVYTRKPHRLSDHGRAGAIFLKVGISFALITLLLYSQGITQRQTKILLFVALSIILFEGFMPFLIVREELRSLMRNSSGKGEQMICNITEDHKWKASNFLFPSVINAMISVTGSIVLGGDLGSLMGQNPYWVFVSIFVVDLLAEAIHRFDCGKRSL